MEKSIETIWKEGFLHKNDLIAPKVNDLYNKKSMHLVDKFRRMFRINLIAIMIGALVLLAAFVLLGAPWVGIFMFFLFSWLVLYSKRLTDKLKSIDNYLNSYQYIKDFDNWLQRVIESYTKIYRFLYPAFFLAFKIGFWHSTPGKKIVESYILDNPDSQLILGVPIYWMLGAIIFAGLLAIFAGKIYRFDIKLIYGPVFRKLEEMIFDMEELRKSTK